MLSRSKPLALAENIKCLQGTAFSLTESKQSESLHVLRLSLRNKLLAEYLEDGSSNSLEWKQHCLQCENRQSDTL